MGRIVRKVSGFRRTGEENGAYWWVNIRSPTGRCAVTVAQRHSMGGGHGGMNGMQNLTAIARAVIDFEVKMVLGMGIAC